VINKTFFRFLIPGMILAALACERDISDPISTPINDVVPETPFSLVAAVGDASVILSWSVTDTSAQAEYYIYMADSSGAGYSRRAETAELSYTIGDLQNGRRYFFMVSSVNSSGFEGYKSDPVSAIPNLYSIMINNDDEFTSSRDVTLGLAAPADTPLMQVSDDSTFINSVWEIYVPTRVFRLTPGDGSKSVYCRYRDASGRTTADYFGDTIILDTESFVDSISFSPSGMPFSPGDSVHFALFAGETGGSAAVAIGDEIVSLELNDDGARGDSQADDGIYELDYIIAANLDFENMVVYGNFIDRAGNIAVPAVASIPMTVRRAPDPVTLYSVSPPEQYSDRLQLAWSSSGAQDFARYMVYRDMAPGVDSTDYLARAITSRAVVTATDTGLQENTQYFYRIYVLDNTGLLTGSNEMAGTTNQDLPPQPVVLQPTFVEPDRYSEVALEWSRSVDFDFESYRLFRWREDVGRDDSTLVFLSADIDDISFTDSPPFDIPEDTLNYWYIVHVYDMGGGSAGSDSIRVHLQDDIPPQVTGAVAPSDSSLIISWLASDIPDFSRYHLLRDIDSDTTGAITIYVTSNQDITSYTDEATTDDQTYFYWLDIFDARGNKSRSPLGSGSW
jgi:hypothetical protein